MKITPPIERIYFSLSDKERDNLYRLLWAKHVYEDLKEYQKQGFGPQLNKEGLQAAAFEYVEGEYDCNASYWVNLETLLQNYCQKEEYLRKPFSFLIKKGIEEGLVKIQDAEESYGTSGIICHINNNEFYFNDACGDAIDYDDFIHQQIFPYNQEEMADDIADTLFDMSKEPVFQDEVLGYLYYLQEKLPEEYQIVMNEVLQEIEKNITIEKE